MGTVQLLPPPAPPLPLPTCQQIITSFPSLKSKEASGKELCISEVCHKVGTAYMAKPHSSPLVYIDTQIKPQWHTQRQLHGIAHQNIGAAI